MSSVTEIGLFQSQEGLFHGKFLDENGFSCEGEFVNTGDGNYAVTFSGNMGTKISGNNFEYNIGSSKNGKRIFSDKLSDGEFIGEGIYIDGLFNGKGKYRELGEEMDIYYEGNFVNGRIEGYGKKTIVWKFGNGMYAKETIEGEFKNGKPCGYCTYLSKNEYSLSPFLNWKVEGVFEGDYLKNFGKITDREDGTIYIGETKLNFPHGKGKITYSDGESFEGIFENGILKICNNLISSGVRGPIGWEIYGVEYSDFNARYLGVEEYI